MTIAHCNKLAQNVETKKHQKQAQKLLLNKTQKVKNNVVLSFN